MQLDAWFSMVIFTVATVAFYFLGAAVLHPQGLDPKGPEMIPTLSRMYLQPLEGTPLAWMRPFTRVGFLLGAWAVLFKTLYVATAANSRMTADFLHRAGVWRPVSQAARERMVKLFCVVYPAAALALYYAFREPQALITAGGIAQALMLPFIAGATIYLRRRDADGRVGPSLLSDLLTWVAFAGDLGRRPLHHLQPAPGYRGRLGRPALRDRRPGGAEDLPQSVAEPLQDAMRNSPRGTDRSARGGHRVIVEFFLAVSLVADVDVIALGQRAQRAARRRRTPLVGIAGVRAPRARTGRSLPGQGGRIRTRALAAERPAIGPGRGLRTRADEFGDGRRDVAQAHEFVDDLPGRPTRGEGDQQRHADLGADTRSRRGRRARVRRTPRRDRP